MGGKRLYQARGLRADRPEASYTWIAKMSNSPFFTHRGNVATLLFQGWSSIVIPYCPLL